MFQILSTAQYIMIFSVSHRSIICLSRIIDLLSTEKSRYFAQPRSVITYYHSAIEILIVTASAMNDSPSPLFFTFWVIHLSSSSLQNEGTGSVGTDKNASTVASI